MLERVILFLEDLREIFSKRRGTKRSLKLFVAHLRIRLKQIISRCTRLNLKQEKFLGLKVFFPDYGRFVNLWREIFVREDYNFASNGVEPFIIDAGSNIGMSTCFFKYIYPSARVIAFEPDPEAFKWLERNILGNNFKNVVAHNAALGSEGGAIPFYKHSRDEASATNSTMRGFGGESRRLITVRSEKLSNFINQEVDLLKIDVEGSEFEIFEELDKNNKLKLVKRIFVEVHGGGRLGKHKISLLLKILDRNKFRYAFTRTFLNHHDFINTPTTPDAFMLDAERLLQAKKFPEPLPR